MYIEKGIKGREEDGRGKDINRKDLKPMTSKAKLRLYQEDILISQTRNRQDDTRGK